MPLLPSQISLLISLTAYPALLRLLTGPSPNAVRFAKATKVISTVHSILITSLALYVLSKPQWRRAGSPALQQTTATATTVKSRMYPDDSVNPTITGRSEFANAVTAVECGYLIQDTIVLLLPQARLNGMMGGEENLDKTLLTHHIGIGGALLVLQYYIARGRERGIYIIVQYLLMNASTPVLCLRWYVRHFWLDWKGARLFTDIAFVAAFFAARVWLVAKILGVVGVGGLVRVLEGFVGTV